MALQSFEQQILDLIGDTLAGNIGLDTEMLDNWGTQGVRDIISKLPLRLLNHMGAETSLANSSGATITTNRILGVTREDTNGILRPARKVSHVLEERLEDTDDLMYAPPTDPAWFPKNGKIYVKPNPTSSEGAKISVVSYPLVDAGTDIAITGFPDELERLVVVFMLIQTKLREMGVSRIDAQTEIEAITDSGILGNIDYTGIEKALDDANTEAAKIDEVIVAASAEFDKIVAATTGPLDLANAKIDEIFVATTGSLDLINTAVDRVNAAVILANAEFDLMNPDIDTASSSISTDKHIDQGRAELQVADGRAKTGITYLREATAGIEEATGYATEAQSRLNGAASYLKEAASRGVSGENYIKEAQAIIGNVAALLQEAGARIGQAQTYLQESGIRINTAQRYLAQSQGARDEVNLLQEQYDADIKTYVSNA